MSKTIERVCIDDVYPWEDEYGNTPLSRDWSIKENEEYLAEMARSIGPKGSPREMPILGRDGGIYRIVGGNTRVEAMRRLGTASFDAVVLDDADMDDAVATALETNVKMKYVPSDESRFVQLSMKRWDDEAVAASTGMDPKRVARIRRGLRAVGDPTVCEQLTLDWAEAIAPFEGDAAAVQRLTACGKNEWPSVARTIEREREIKALKNALAASCAELGIALLDKAPRGARMLKEVWNITAENARGGIEAEADPETCVVVCKSERWGGVSVIVYGKPEDVSDDEAEKIASYNAQKRAMASDKRRRAAFVGRRMAETGIAGLGSTGAIFAEAAKLNRYDTSRFCEKAGIDEVPMRASEWLIATKWEQLDGMTQDELAAIVNGKRKRDHRGYGKRAAETFLALFEALEADGYEASESELALASKCRKTIEEED